MLTGQVRYKGQNIAGQPAHQISRLGIALVPETRGVFSYLSARENLEMGRRAGARWTLEAALVFEGTPAALRTDVNVTATYLGVGGPV